MAVRPLGLMNDCVRRKPLDFAQGIRRAKYLMACHEQAKRVEWLPD
ncbi:MAG TPA: hypothetical protein VNV14_05730 [Opitutaceae bacterium]|nr:hypothetical protein [Opitutaceae bacterium]